MDGYSFDQVIPIFGAVPLSGFAEGDDAIQVGRRVDTFALVVGADGRGVGIRNADQSGEIVFKLLQTSPSSLYLSGLLQAQEAGLFLPIPFLLMDIGNQIQLAAAPECIIQKYADQQYGQGHNVREWTVLAEQLELIG